MRHALTYRIGESPRTVRKRSSRDDRETAASLARLSTVHLRSGAVWMAFMAGASIGSRSPASHPRSDAGAVARCKRKTSMSSISGSFVVRIPPPPDVSSRAYSMLASNYARAGPGGGRTTNAGGNTFRAGSNSGSSEYRHPQTISVRDPPSP